MDLSDYFPMIIIFIFALGMGIVGTLSIDENTRQIQICKNNGYLGVDKAVSIGDGNYLQCIKVVQQADGRLVEVTGLVKR